METPLQPPTNSSAPSRGRFVAFSVLFVAAVAASFFVIQNVRANADYICTYIIEDAGECTNGSWSEWATVSTNEDSSQCSISKVEKRTYTGTRTTQHVLQYLNRRTACDAGYAQELAGDSGGSSGFHGGTIFSQAVACQIEETRTMRNPGTGPNCGLMQVISAGFDMEGNVGSAQEISSIDELTQFRISMIDASISTRPTLVRRGGTTLVKWQGREVTECTVTGSNGDSWTGTSGEQTSGSITEATIYDLNCTAFNGVVVSDRAVVEIAPVFLEN